MKLDVQLLGEMVIKFVILFGVLEFDIGYEYNFEIHS